MYAFDELIEKEYEKDNYRVIDLPNNSEICLIFFTSHALYFPNTEYDFVKTIMIKDRYEWINTIANPLILKNAGRIILCRDLYKQFYVTGINKKACTIEKTINLLKELTARRKVITIGSSAGGYMAMVTGMMLGAEYVINNGGRFDVTDVLSDSEIIVAAKTNPENIKYLNIMALLPENRIPIYYFYAKKNEIEVQSFYKVSKYNCVKGVAFSERKHATTVFPGNWAYLILYREILQKLFESSQKKALWKIEILFETVPLKEALYIFMHEVKEALKRIGKHR